VTESVRVADQPLAARTSWTALVAKLYADGSPAWSVTSSGDGIHRISALAAAGDGELYAGGDFTGNLGFGGEVLAAENAGDAFLARFAADGEPLWLISLEGDGAQIVHDLRVANDGSVLLAGSYAASLLLGGREYPRNPSFDRTPFVALITAEGDVRWVQAGLTAVDPHQDHIDHSGAGAADGTDGGVSLHAPNLFDRIRIATGPDERVLTVATYGHYTGLHSQSFEAPTASALLINELSADGELVSRQSSEAPHSLFQFAALVAAQSEMQLAASFSGELEIAGHKDPDSGARKLLFATLNGQGALENPRKFTVNDVSLSMTDAVAGSGGALWVAARWSDPLVPGDDAWLGRFEP
jgi:hypothetical protein